MGNFSCVLSGHMMRSYKETNLCLLVSLMSSHSLVFGVPLPQQITQQDLLTPLNVVRFTGNTAISTGQSVVHSVPDAVNTVPNTAVQGVNLIPQSVNTVSNVAVGAINSVPDTIDNTVTFGANAIRNAPTNTINVVNGAVNTVGSLPGQFVHFGN